MAQFVKFVICHDQLHRQCAQLVWLVHTQIVTAQQPHLHHDVHQVWSDSIQTVTVQQPHLLHVVSQAIWAFTRTAIYLQQPHHVQCAHKVNNFYHFIFSVQVKRF